VGEPRQAGLGADTACVREPMMRRGRLICALLLAFVFAISAFAVNATACEGGGGGGGELTGLSTRLSGGGKEGEELTVAEGTKVKDKATLTGKDASKATGKVTYKVYSEKNCATLVKSAGEVTVSGESVPASNEEELEAGKAYYWQAHYSGDANNAESTSPCNEVLDVQAKTSLSTKLSGEGKEAGELTINEGSKAKDTATLSGTNSSSAGGKVLYKIYSEKECKTLVKEAGEVTVSSGSVPASSEEELEGDKTYYWQATYRGDSLHQESSSSCGSEVLKVKAKTSLSTELSEEGEEGEELTVDEDQKVKDKATLEGPNSSTAEGKAVYKIYSEKECKTLVKEAGEVTVSSGSIPASSEEELEGDKTYYWQATYRGDSLHQESTSKCGKGVEKVIKCTKPYCEPTITPGVQLNIPLESESRQCTAGPIMSKGTEKFVLTAGHCFEVNLATITQQVLSLYPKEVVAGTEREVGKTVLLHNTDDYDIAEVKVENTAWSPAPILVEWGAAPKVVSVVGKAANKVGEVTCMSGITSGLRCGEVVQLDVTRKGTANLIETSVSGVKGDSGGPEFGRTAGGVLIQGVYTIGEAYNYRDATGNLTVGSNLITEVPEAKKTCDTIAAMKTEWTTAGVPIEGNGINPKTTITECKEPGANAEIKMSAAATKTGGKVAITIGHTTLSDFEPMSQIEAAYPDQTLLVK
jgi:hypothetical protein